MRRIKFPIGLILLLLMSCSTKILVPVQADKYDQLGNEERIIVHLKNGERRSMNDCAIQDDILTGTRDIIYPFRKERVEIRTDSIAFILSERKSINDIVPMKSVPDASLNKYDEIFVIQINGESLEIRNPLLVDDVLQGEIENKKLNKKYKSIPLASISAVAVRGILDPWGNPISYREIRQNYFTNHRYNAGLGYFLLSGMGTLIPSIGIATVFFDESSAACLLVWCGCMAVSSKMGYERGEKRDQNRALEKILLERFKRIAGDSSSVVIPNNSSFP